MQPTGEDVAASVAGASTWDERVAIIRRVPERFGVAALPGVYAAIAERAYVPSLAPDFAFVHWKPEYAFDSFRAAYEMAIHGTEQFHDVDVVNLERVINREPSTLRVFRTILGLTSQEFAACTAILAEMDGNRVLTNGRVKNLETGAPARQGEAIAAAGVVDAIMTRRIFDSPAAGLTSKIDKPDTLGGWQTVRELAAAGVPYDMFLHQRHFGGAFRQLLDATSSKRGDIIEDAVAALLERNHVPFIRTGSANQREVSSRFGLTVRPSPDFVIADSTGELRAILECKGANDGGTARDKAARFVALRREAARLGGVPVFAVLAGLGWTRTRDALGPVVEATDGRVFTPTTLINLTDVQPISQIARTSAN